MEEERVKRRDGGKDGVEDAESLHRLSREQEQSHHVVCCGWEMQHHAVTGTRIAVQQGIHLTNISAGDTRGAYWELRVCQRSIGAVGVSKHKTRSIMSRSPHYGPHSSLFLMRTENLPTPSLPSLPHRLRIQIGDATHHESATMKSRHVHIARMPVPPASSLSSSASSPSHVRHAHQSCRLALKTFTARP